MCTWRTYARDSCLSRATRYAGIVTSAESETELPELGSVIAGKYEIVRVIGKGGMGIVYEAKHLRLNQRVAIKMLKPAALQVSEFKPRFEREARTAALLRGHHVARIFDVDATERGLPFMVMEYLVGRDLDAELQDRGTLSVMEATGYVLQACVAMQEAHAAGIVHRDLKPANLFLTEENGERVVKVLDFGISKLTHEVDTHLTGTFATVGTPLYMSPEQVRSSRSVDSRSDIWSLAVILFEALAGRPPFHGSMTATAAAIVADKTPSLCALRPDVPIELEAALGRALEKHPNRRYQDVASLSAALAPFGPARLPFTSLSDTSNPILPPGSGPSLSSRVLPPNSGPNVGDWGSASETMMIPADERGATLDPVPKPSPRRVALLASVVGVGMLAVLTTALLLRGPTSPSAVVRVAASSAPSSAVAVMSVVAPPTMSSAEPSASAPAASSSATAVAASVAVRPSPSAPGASYAATTRPSPAVPHVSRPPSAVTPPAGGTPRPAPSPANPVFLQ